MWYFDDTWCTYNQCIIKAHFKSHLCTWHWRLNTIKGWLSRFSATKLTNATPEPMYFFIFTSKIKVNWVNTLFFYIIVNVPSSVSMGVCAGGFLTNSSTSWYGFMSRSNSLRLGSSGNPLKFIGEKRCCRLNWLWYSSGPAIFISLYIITYPYDNYTELANRIYSAILRPTQIVELSKHYRLSTDRCSAIERDHR